MSATLLPPVSAWTVGHPALSSRSRRPRGWRPGTSATSWDRVWPSCAPSCADDSGAAVTGPAAPLLAAGVELGDPVQVDRDEHPLGLGDELPVEEAATDSGRLAALDGDDLALDPQLAVQRRRPPVADGQGSGHSGLAAERLGHAQQLVEHGGHVSTVDAP